MIPFIKIDAKNHYDFGLQLGKRLKKKKKLRIKKNKEAYKKRGAWDYSELVNLSRKFLPSIKKRYPELLREVEGISLSSGVNFDDLLVLLCEEELLDLKMAKVMPHCTNVAIKTSNNNIMLGHNEDWLPEYRENGLVVINGKIGNNKFLSLGFIGSFQGTSCGPSDRGI